MSAPIATAKAIISVPLYNEENYIKQTIGCLKNVPEHPGLKFFVSDNCSTDQSYEIVQDLVGKDDRFIVHQQPENIGAYENFKFVFEKSESDYFMWLGGHDEIDPGYPAAAIKILDENDDAAYAQADPYKFVQDPANENAHPMKEAKYEFHEQQLVRYLQSVGQLVNCTVVNSMFRRKWTEGMEFRQTLSNDHVLISRMLWYGKIYVTEGQKYYRRVFQHERETQDERITGKAQTVMSRVPFFEYYVDDFQNLYNKPGPMQDYLCNKILALLENRYGIDKFGDR